LKGRFGLPRLVWGCTDVVCPEKLGEIDMRDQHIPFVADANEAAGEKARVILAPPKVEPLLELFSEAMLEDASTHQHRSPFDWIASAGVHVAILVALLIMPLYFTAGLDSARMRLTFLAPPQMPAAPPPPMVSSIARPARVAVQRVFSAGKLIAPTFIPKAIATGPAVASAPPDDELMGVSGGVPGGIPGGQLGGVFGGVLGGIPKGVAPPSPVAAGPKVPLRVGGDVKPPRLLFGPAPDYPVLARQARLGGVVVIDAIIDEHGDVRGMRVVSGHPLLVQAALNAVSKRKYEPTILDGEPTPIDLKVEVSFSFSS
jgi:periplasmic protein TonB